MSTHTTYFCDRCNNDREISRSDDDGYAVNYGEYPTGDGWAEYNRIRTDEFGGIVEELHHCAHCLAAPDYQPPGGGWAVGAFDTTSAANVEAGRKHGEAMAWALDHLGRGVRQVFQRSDYGYRPGPQLPDGHFSYREAARARARDWGWVIPAERWIDGLAPDDFPEKRPGMCSPRVREQEAA